MLHKPVLLRLPSLFLLLYFALFHRPTTERRPRELRLISLPTKVLFIKIGFLKKLTSFLKRWTNFLKKLTTFLKPLTYLFKEKNHLKRRFFLLKSTKYRNFAPRNEPFSNLCVCISEKQMKIIRVTRKSKMPIAVSIKDNSVFNAIAEVHEKD